MKRPALLVNTACGSISWMRTPRFVRALGEHPLRGAALDVRERAHVYWACCRSRMRVIVPHSGSATEKCAPAMRQTSRGQQMRWRCWMAVRRSLPVCDAPALAGRPAGTHPGSHAAAGAPSTVLARSRRSRKSPRISRKTRFRPSLPRCSEPRRRTPSHTPPRRGSFAVARTSACAMLKLSPCRDRKRWFIYPVSFYRNTQAPHGCARASSFSPSRTAWKLPTTMEELLTLPGVGRKTANLVPSYWPIAKCREHLLSSRYNKCAISISELARMGRDADAGRDCGISASARRGPPEVVARAEPAPCNLGAERGRFVVSACAAVACWWTFCLRIGVTKVGKRSRD